MWDALDRYMAGEAAPSETEITHADFVQLPHLMELKVLLNDSRNYTGITEATESSDQVPNWEALRERIAIADSQSVPKGSTTKISKRSTYRWYAGAIMGFSMILGFFVWGVNPNSETSLPPIESRIYTTHPGQPYTEIDLSNQSKAVLGPATRLTVRREANSFYVTVEGQAVFTVAHSSKTPFVVHTKQSITRVLGTTFLVRQYDTDRSARIVVSEGRVGVYGALGARLNESYSVLTANTLALVSDSGVSVTPNVVAIDYTAWATGEMVFNATPLRDVIADLSRVYDVDIRIADAALAELPINWSVQTTRYSLSQVLPELLLMLRAQAKESGRTITITPG